MNHNQIRKKLRNYAAESFWQSRGDQCEYLRNVAFGEFLAFKHAQAMME